MKTDLVERGDGLPALPQARGLQALEDSRERTAGPVSPRAGVPARPRQAATCRQTHAQLMPYQEEDAHNTFFFLMFPITSTCRKADIHLFS